MEIKGLSYYEKNKEAILKRAKERYLINREEKIAYAKEYALLHRDKVREWKSKHRNKEESKQKRRLWISLNKEKINKKISEYTKKREEVDINFKLARRLRHRINIALKGKNKSISTLELLGCSVEDFKIHISSKFTSGMSWDNYGEWHIDHIKPLASFDLSNIDELKLASHYTNMQPLWAIDNILKRDKYAVT